MELKNIKNTTCRFLTLPLAQTRRQTGQTYQFAGVYKGFGAIWLRTVGLMGIYFVLIDSFRRNLPHWFSSPVMGPFLMSGIIESGD